MASMGFNHMLAYTLLLVCSCSAFKIQFWLGEYCTSAEFAQRIESYTHHGKCRQVPTNAEAATVQKQSRDHAVDEVAFYSGSHCKKRVAASNTGCVDFTGTGKNAQSYRILRNGHAAEDVSQHEQRAVETRSDEQAESNPLSCDSEPLADDEDNPYGHGKLATLWEVDYRWWQPTPGVTFGIPLDDWDDDVHVLNVNGSTRFHEIEGDDSSFSVDVLGERDLEKRLDREWCVQILQRCLESTAYPVAHGISLYFARGYRRAAAAVPQRHEVYDWLHKHPYSVSIGLTVGGTVAGYALGKTEGGATAQDNKQLDNCATGPVANAVEGLIQAVHAADPGEANAIKMDITLKDGHVLQLSAAIVKKDHVPRDVPCGAPHP